MAKPEKQQREIQTTDGKGTKPKRRRGRPEKVTKIDDTPLNVARALWGERSTKFTKKIEEKQDEDGSKNT